MLLANDDTIYDNGLYWRYEIFKDDHESFVVVTAVDSEYSTICCHVIVLEDPLWT
jgi:hypothetical protein